MHRFRRWLRTRAHIRDAAQLSAEHPPAVALTDLDDEFRTVFAKAPMGIAVIDSQGRIVRSNAALERFLGYSQQELAGRTIASVTHPDDLASEIVLYGRLQRGEFEKHQSDKRYIRKDGVIVWGRVVVSLMRGPDGVTIYGIGMLEDISEQFATRKQLEASRSELEYLNRRLALYLERAPLACIVWGTDRRVREWNPAAEALFGYSAAEAIGRNVYELTCTPAGLAAIEKFRAQAPTDREFNEKMVVENRRKDGSRFNCEWHFSVILNRAASVDGVIAFGIDISERERSEQERRMLEINLRQAQKMQSLGTLAGGIAHDFNNILLAISGNARLAMQELDAGHPAHASLAEISKAGTRAAGIVNQILTFSRREEDSQYAPLSLHTIIEDSVSLLRATLPARISIVMRLDPAAPMAFGDASQIHQVLLNLVTNAAYAMGENGGVLDIGLDRVEVDEELVRRCVELRPGIYSCITVHDTGIGMTPQVIERVFEPFFTTKPRGQGTGLGLSVVHGIVRAHGAAIVVESEPGAGSTFRVFLPSVATPATAVAVTVAPVSRGAGQHILYVDDEEPLVYLLTRILERLGYRVSGFTDPMRALAAFQSDPGAFHALVTDLSMPGLSGHDLAREILKISPSLPVVMTSGYVRSTDRDTAIQNGVRELVLKPDTAQALGEILHRVLNEPVVAQT
ncbi:MAG TPA: PAS domain S-box protein [Steroidobacteraceae bacterium]|jgi:PAS domain S-box-containing protein